MRPYGRGVQLWVDAARGLAGREGELLPLSAREVALLDALARGGGRVMGRRELCRRVGLARHHPRRCDSLVVPLRKALGPGAIVTVRGRGWRCLADVVLVGAPT